MKATASIDKTGITHDLAATGDTDGYGNPVQDKDTWIGKNTGKPESELRAAARRKGLNLKELAALMGVTPSHLGQVANGNKPLTPGMRDKIAAALGEVPGQGVVYQQGGAVPGGQSTYIRERAREQGMSLRQVADRAGISYHYLSQASRGHRHLSPKVQKQVEEVLQAPVKVEAARPADIDPRALWERMDAHGYSQNETARRAGISTGHLSQIMNGQRTPSGDVLRRLHEVLFAPSQGELVAPVELRVLAWKKGRRNGVVVRGAGGPRNGTIRTGGRVPWGAEVEFAYTTGYDSHGRVSVNHIVDERGCAAMLKRGKPEGI
ncbi:MAG: helix-turn-helix domain-containing protein [Chloroflexota bacterium]|nr:helix-turn-helix domain-containing protein [Chloroflexota bacterium]